MSPICSNLAEACKTVEVPATPLVSSMARVLRLSLSPKNHVSSGNSSQSRYSDGGLEAELDVEIFQTAARAATEMSSANTLRLARLPRYTRRTESGDTSPYEDDAWPSFCPSGHGTSIVSNLHRNYQQALLRCKHYQQALLRHASRLRYQQCCRQDTQATHCNTVHYSPSLKVHMCQTPFNHRQHVLSVL